MSDQIIVQYVDCTYPVRIGRKVGVKPHDHPNELLNGNWIKVGPVESYFNSACGPRFTVGSILYTPTADTDPLPNIEPIFLPRRTDAVSINVKEVKRK